MNKLDRALTGFLREALADTLETGMAESLAQQLTPIVLQGLAGAASYAHHVPSDPVADAIWNGVRELGAAVGQNHPNR